MPTIETIVAYEQGDLSYEQTVEHVADLVRTGLAWSFQGQYGRTARDLIEAGYITPDGQVVAGNPEEH